MLVGAAISRPLLFRQRKCFRLSETLRNLNVFGRLIAAPTVAMQRVCRAVAPVGSGQLSFERKDRPEGYLQPVFFCAAQIGVFIDPGAFAVPMEVRTGLPYFSIRQTILHSYSSSVKWENTSAGNPTRAPMSMLPRIFSIGAAG